MRFLSSLRFSGKSCISVGVELTPPSYPCLVHMRVSSIADARRGRAFCSCTTALVEPGDLLSPMHSPCTLSCPTLLTGVLRVGAQCVMTMTRRRCKHRSGRCCRGLPMCCNYNSRQRISMVRADSVCGALIEAARLVWHRRAHGFVEAH